MMHIVLLSEHGDPLIGGATHLAKKIAEALSGEGHQITFVVPNSNSSSTIESRIKDSFRLVKVKALVAIDDRSKFKGKTRRQYAMAVSDYLKTLNDREPIHIIQILSGMYLMRYLDIPYFKNHGIKVVAGLLNVPPEECGLSWKGDNPIRYFKDELRKILIGFINKIRISYHKYDAYTVESLHVKTALAKIVNPSLINYIPLGTDETEVRKAFRKPGNRIKILTVGGINPSKNQHIIPSIACQLSKMGKEFEWNIIGPDRNSRYTQFLKNEILEKGVKDSVVLTLGMPKEQLMEYYAEADLYVQTSIEEGFCMTALDAIIYGLPLIGINTGAISEFIEKGKGILVGNNIDEFCDSINKIIENPIIFNYGHERITPVIEFYNWKRIGQTYLNLYSALLNKATTDSIMETQYLNPSS